VKLVASASGLKKKNPLPGGKEGGVEGDRFMSIQPPRPESKDENSKKLPFQVIPSQDLFAID